MLCPGNIHGQHTSKEDDQQFSILLAKGYSVLNSAFPEQRHDDCRDSSFGFAVQKILIDEGVAGDLQTFLVQNILRIS
jgi:hypothetical protein